MNATDMGNPWGVRRNEEREGGWAGRDENEGVKMGRIRTIKPEFWKNEKLSALPEATHMLAAALINYADDEGYFNANTKLVKAECCPLREPSVSIHGSLTELSRIEYLRLGTFGDRVYGHILNFSEHQRVNRPSPSKIKDLQIVWEDSGSPPGMLIEDSVNTHGNISEDSLSAHCRKGKEQGREGNRNKEKKEKISNSENGSEFVPKGGKPPHISHGWYRDIYAPLAEQATCQITLYRAKEFGQARSYFESLSKLNPHAPPGDIILKATLGAEIVFDGWVNERGPFHWLKDPPNIGWLVSNVDKINLAVTARESMTEEEIERERETDETYEELRQLEEKLDEETDRKEQEQLGAGGRVFNPRSGY